MPPNDSAFWPLIKATVISIIVLGGSTVLYKNGFATQDVLLLMGVVAGVWGVDFAHAKSAKNDSGQG